MKLYVADSEKLVEFDLPKNIEESSLFKYIPSSSNKEYTITIEAQDGKWYLKSNGMVNSIMNGTISLDTLLNENSRYEIELMDSKDTRYLYTSSLLDESYNNLSVYNLTNITIGSTSACNICYQNNSMAADQAVISFNNNQAMISTNYEWLYVNDKAVRQAILKTGDVIFVHGLKIIFMGSYIRVNNPSNQVVINGLQADANLLNIDNTNYEKQAATDSNYRLYNDDDYFYHTPRIKNFILEQHVKIDSPPQAEKDENLPFILSLGTSITMLGSSMISMYTVINGLKTGESSISRAIPSIIMCVLMIVGSMIMPRIVGTYQKKRKAKREALRQQKYGAYLAEKEKEIKTLTDVQQQILNTNYPDAKTCVDIITKKTKQLWERTLFDDDFLSVRFGTGNTNSKLVIEAPEKSFTLDEDNLRDKIYEIVGNYKQLKNVPIYSSLLENKITSVICQLDNKTDYINNIILQLVTMHSAIDLKIVFLTGNKSSKYEYIKYLPHAWSEDKTVRFYADNLTDMKTISEFLEKDIKDRREKLAESANGSKDEESQAEADKDYQNFSTYYLVITDNYKKVKGIKVVEDIVKMQKNIGYSLLVIDSNQNDIPTNCKNFVFLNSAQKYLLTQKDESNEINNFSVEDVINVDMDYISKCLSNIPISAKKGTSELPKSLNFLEMYNVSKIEQLNILDRWKKNDPTTSLKTPIGVHADRDLFILDLHEKAHGPHGLIAGSTGSGKSEFIITFILSMAINYHPNEVAFVLIDYKGGGLAGAFENREKGISIPHLAGTITNLDTSEMSRTLVSINSELKRRQAEFNKARDMLGEGTIDIYKYQRFYREGKVKEPIPHLFIVSDEFAELKAQQPDFMDELISTARIGRSLGVHLILATQKPSGVVNDQIWANSKFKICLKVQDRSDSMEMLKKPDAASIKETGRFYLQVGYDEYFDIGQSGWAGAKYIPSDRVVNNLDNSIELISNTGETYKSIEDDEKEVTPQEDLGEQLPNIVKYIVELAKKQNIKTKMLWLSSIPDMVYIEGLKTKYNYVAKPYEINPIIGEYDNPSKQEQGILTLDLTNVGNTVIYGMPGSGKENLLTTIIHTTCIEHSPDEINFYVLDFGAETLKVFAKYPHVGGVATLDDKEMVENLFGMVYKEMINRKELFSEYGGNYKDYINESGKKLPMITVVINGYDVMNENFGRLEEHIFPILREGAKYGITFIVTTSLSNAISNRTAQMFLNTISLQQKSDDVYRDLVGSPKGLAPKKYFGRGIIAKNKTGYEFQTAYIAAKDKINETIRNSIKTLNEKYPKGAVKIKTFPQVCTLDMIEEETTGINHVAIGVNRATLNTSFYNFDNLPVTMILSSKIFDNFGFIRTLIKQFSTMENVETTVVDATQLYKENLDNVVVYNSDYDNAFKNVIMGVNKEGQDTTKRVFFLVGVGIMKQLLSDQGKKYFDLLFTNINRFKNSKIILVDDYTPFQSLEMEPWYNDVINNTNGIWLGADPGNQNAIDFSSITREQKEINFNNIAYVPGANGVIVFKYVTDESGDDDGREQSVS